LFGRSAQAACESASPDRFAEASAKAIAVYIASHRRRATRVT
jgi:hypothetical protein